MKTKTTLKSLLKSCNFDYINPNIETLFPYEEPKGEIGVKNFGKWISSEEAIAELKKEGLRPATATELFDWVSKNLEWVGWVVALGSVAEFEGLRLVCNAWLDDSARRAILHSFDDGWDARYWFAFSRESSDTKPLRSDTLPLELEINGVKYRKV